jgi:hypothetical protein
MLKPVVQQAHQRLHLAKAQRHQPLLRWDAGCGTDENFNWALNQEYQILGTVSAQKRVAKLLRSGRAWIPEQSSSTRAFGIVSRPDRYARKTQQVIVNIPRKSPSPAWGYGALVSTLLHVNPQELADLYDNRAEAALKLTGGLDRQGLGLSTRRKHRMAAQHVVIHLAERAHTLLVWAARQRGHPMSQYGILKLVRDVFQGNGSLLIEQTQPMEIGLHRHHPLAHAWRDGFKRLLAGHPHITLWDPVEYVKEHERGVRNTCLLL